MDHHKKLVITINGAENRRKKRGSRPYGGKASAIKALWGNREFVKETETL